MSFACQCGGAVEEDEDFGQVVCKGCGAVLSPGLLRSDLEFTADGNPTFTSVRPPRSHRHTQGQREALAALRRLCATAGIGQELQAQAAAIFDAVVQGDKTYRYQGELQLLAASALQVVLRECHMSIPFDRLAKLLDRSADDVKAGFTRLDRSLHKLGIRKAAFVSSPAKVVDQCALKLVPASQRIEVAAKALSLVNLMLSHTERSSVLLGCAGGAVCVVLEALSPQRPWKGDLGSMAVGIGVNRAVLVRSIREAKDLLVQLCQGSRLPFSVTQDNLRDHLPFILKHIDTLGRMASSKEPAQQTQHSVNGSERGLETGETKEPELPAQVDSSESNGSSIAVSSSNGSGISNSSSSSVVAGATTTTQDILNQLMRVRGEELTARDGSDEEVDSLLYTDKEVRLRELLQPRTEEQPAQQKQPSARDRHTNTNSSAKRRKGDRTRAQTWTARDPDDDMGIGVNIVEEYDGGDA
eukprot:m.9706 g.9706  ORF g.9706 m.9706 type:complete len:470 (-) comp5002_c0_seq1:363-1772(-)